MGRDATESQLDADEPEAAWEGQGEDWRDEIQGSRDAQGWPDEKRALTSVGQCGIYCIIAMQARINPELARKISAIQKSMAVKVSVNALVNCYLDAGLNAPKESVTNPLWKTPKVTKEVGK